MLYCILLITLPVQLTSVIAPRHPFEADSTAKVNYSLPPFSRNTARACAATTTVPSPPPQLQRHWRTQFTSRYTLDEVTARILVRSVGKQNEGPILKSQTTFGPRASHRHDLLLQENRLGRVLFKNCQSARQKHAGSAILACLDGITCLKRTALAVGILK